MASDKSVNLFRLIKISLHNYLQVCFLVTDIFGFFKTQVLFSIFASSEEIYLKILNLSIKLSDHYIF